MIIRPGGGSNGANMQHYMETGEKHGRTHTRDELDSRIILEGDLTETSRTIDEMHTASQDTERFLHITLGFKEDYISPEMLEAINADMKDFLLGGRLPGEMTYYAEAHNPKIKTEIDQHGKVVERKAHIHVIVPKVNNLTGQKDDPLGMLSARFGSKYTTEQILDAFQEHINHKYGLASPKDFDSRRDNFAGKAEIISRLADKDTGIVYDFTGKTRKTQQIIRDRMIEEKIETPEAFRAMLEKIGTVSIGKEGQHDQYLKIMPHGEQKNTRLDDWQFSNEFITKPTAEKEAFIHQERVRRYLETIPGRPTPEKCAEILSEWEQRRDENRFIHTDSKLYKEKYKEASAEEKKDILAQLKVAHYAGAKAEFGYDNNQLAPQAELDKQATQEAEYQAALLVAFPNRRLNASHLRGLPEIREAIAAGDAIIADPMSAIDALTFSQSTVTSRDLERYLLKNTADAEQYTAAMSAVLDVPGLVTRQDEYGNTTFTTADIEQIERDLIERVSRMAGTGKEPSREEIDAQLAEQTANAPTAAPANRAQPINEEENNSTELSNLHDTPSLHDLPNIHDTEDDQIAREVASAKSMNEGQDAAYNLLVSDRQIAVVNGAPGTGKSYILAAMREAEEQKGNTVYGAILQGKTAEDLERDSGIKSTTMHSFLAKLKNGSIQLNSKSVVVVDEAGMIGSRQMQDLLSRVESACARVRFVGDIRQLSAVEYGSAFKQISDRCEVASLTQIMRQKDEWQRTASEQLSMHEIAEPLKAYSDHGNIHFADDAAAANAAVVDKWNARRKESDDEGLIVLVATNKERKELNNLMREQIKTEGGLKNEIDVETDDGTRQMAVGERIMFTAGDNKLGVKNGTTGTIRAIRDGSIDIVTGEGKRITLRADGRDTEKGNQIDHFYATTVHKSQGMTQGRAIMLASPYMALENTLVGMTRHKYSFDMIVNKQQFADLEALTKGLDRTGRKDFSYDTDKPEWNAIRENDSVVSQYKADFAHDRVIERAAKTAKFAEVRDNLDARELLDRVAKSHGVDTSLYGITKDKEGRDRIECGKRQLNVSDFLTKELHLDYKTEAAPALREAYAAQLERVYAPRREADRPMSAPLPAHQVDKPLWQEFQTYQTARAAAYKENSTALSADHKERRGEIGQSAQEQKTRIERSLDKYAEKRTAKKELRAETAKSIKALGTEISERRGDLMSEYKKSPSVDYKDYLAERAHDSEKHMAELRRVSLTKEDAERIQAIEKSREAEAMGAKEAPAVDSSIKPQEQPQAERAAAPAVEKERPLSRYNPDHPSYASPDDKEKQAAPAPAVTTQPEVPTVKPDLPITHEVKEPIAAAPEITPEQQRENELAASLAQVKDMVVTSQTDKNKDKPIIEAMKSDKQNFAGNVIAHTDKHFVTEERNERVIHEVQDNAVVKSTGKATDREAIARGNFATVSYSKKEGKAAQNIKITERRAQFKKENELSKGHGL